ncbi:hypothetical protein [Thalassobacillus sp. CUG 92003]|uniref:hypothetical protein n=1 Tax=Thalassobacillus sp. CUG 92003 TaxID=2736641 RepID=UPI0015E7B439|nr:hypothetical protein [Thalassobacillus sp. CUG 92003]
MSDDKKKRTAAVRAEGNSRIEAVDSYFEGYDDAASADDESTISLGRNTFIGKRDREELEGLEERLIEEIRKISQEAKDGKDEKRMSVLIQTLSQIGSGTFLGYLKSQGFIE